ncbi:MAG: hypothetical protein GF344_18220 [Chitinivibrionales bacterium]|nr:hypothetical protein [Chitinivibrionales bacterium]MBD3358594.1 hypothetical protein [Chitinivibrionales bacterium]
MAYIPSWFTKAKLGVFVHWGVFNHMFLEKGVPVDERPEGKRGLSREGTERRAKIFTCENFDMDQWAACFRRWGARYAVLTARHSAGFPLWDTKIEPERSIMTMSPYKKDIVEQWCEGLRRAGLRVGIYFCHRDWGDPDFCAEMDGEAFKEPDPAKRAQAWERYIQKRNAKVKELVTNYGKIDQFWADENWGRTAEQLHSQEMIDIIIENQPGVVLNNRYGLPHGGMHSNPEQNVPTIHLKPGDQYFEMCDLLVDNSPHWQYIPGERDYKRKEDVLRFFIDCITSGGNYLVNIGPDPTGKIPTKEIAILDYLGDFCRKNEEAIYGTHAGLERRFYGGGSTMRGNAIYLFAVERGGEEIAFRGIRNQIGRITRLDNGEQRAFRLSGGRPTHNAPPYVWIDTSADQDENRPIVYKVEYEGNKLDICPW